MHAESMNIVLYIEIYVNKNPNLQSGKLSVDKSLRFRYTFSKGNLWERGAKNGF